MKNKKIWLSSPHMGENEFKYVTQAFDLNWIAPVGPHLNDFEKNLSKISDNKYVAALGSGTSAIHLALILLDVERDDEVICSSFTFSASANPIIYQGAKPVFIDSEMDTWNMCPESLELAIIDRIENRIKPKAIIVVHLYGMPAKMNEIIEVASRYNIPIIEDAAEGLGSTYYNKPLGSLTEFGIYSFNGNKIITTSGGGALISSNEDSIKKAKFLATQARDHAPHYEHSQIGYNYRLSNVSAAIGLGQLEVLQDRVERRREIFEHYQKELSDINEISFVEEPDGFYSNRWLTTVLISANSKVSREDLRLNLELNNIESRPLWKPMHLQPIFSSCKYFGSNNAEYLFKYGLCLPSGSNMTENDIARIITNIKRSFEK
ncbi:MAG: pyridoxal phosphate-dependent aminotransferase [Flavobacteriales bacterium]|nr:pyridoxal phosphate-dependent aminotransferase [Flavobacteriales bacterium]|tara:strand:+ start:2398 stop:3528 length:1131 start_codon:yes stop_codon:yes gene_type:complete